MDNMEEKIVKWYGKHRRKSKCEMSMWKKIWKRKSKSYLEMEERNDMENMDETQVE